MTSNGRPKRLLIRLSSLGDVILATSALSALSDATETHWLVASEYADLLEGNPKISKLWTFKRSDGLFGWLKLLEKLWQEGFTEVLDLHSTLRTRIAQLYFFLRGRDDSRQVSWKTIDKQRFRLNGFFVAKRLWPKRLRPTMLVERFAKLAGGTGSERPELSYLTQGSVALPDEFVRWMSQNPEYLCVMPSSKWDGKKWSVRGFYEAISSTKLPVVVLGSRSDKESALLSKILEQSQYPYYSMVGKLGFRQLALVLSNARALLGNDTGLAHLAEAVGTNVVTVFGPTNPDMGFAPWRATSRTVGANLWCNPCGKDGRFCIRVQDRYACQKELKPQVVARVLQSVIQN